MTSYNMHRDGSFVQSSNRVISTIGDWEDPRLIVIQPKSSVDEPIVLAFFQRMWRPFAVARWFQNNNTIGPISQLRLQKADGSIVSEATKNWSPLIYHGTLHFLISAFPLIVVRCETSDYLQWDICVPSKPITGTSSEIQASQGSMILRGGSNFISYPDESSNIFLGFLHSRIREGDCLNLPPNSFLHVPILFIIIQIEDDWHPIYTGHAPSIISGLTNESDVLNNFTKHHIQDPVSLVKHDRESGNVYITMNVADEWGRCALGLYKSLLPPTTMNIEENWILQAAKKYKSYNATIGEKDCVSSLVRLCTERYRVKW